jgi:hypothetical protein
MFFFVNTSILRWRFYSNMWLYVAFVRPSLEYASCGWSPHQNVQSAKIEHNFIRFALRGLAWTTQPLPPYESRCLCVIFLCVWFSHSCVWFSHVLWLERLLNPIFDGETGAASHSYHSYSISLMAKNFALSITITNCETFIFKWKKKHIYTTTWFFKTKGLIFCF